MWSSIREGYIGAFMRENVRVICMLDWSRNIQLLICPVIDSQHILYKYYLPWEGDSRKYHPLSRITVWHHKSEWCKMVILGTDFSTLPSHSWWIPIFSLWSFPTSLWISTSRHYTNHYNTDREAWEAGRWHESKCGHFERGKNLTFEPQHLISNNVAFWHV